MRIGEFLKQKRVDNNYTQDDVAEKIFVSKQTISSWENSRSYPDIISLLHLSEFIK